MISALDEMEKVVRCIEMGAEDYLPKPFEPTLLHARISSSLERKRLNDLQQLYLESLEREMEIEAFPAEWIPIDAFGRGACGTRNEPRAR